MDSAAGEAGARLRQRKCQTGRGEREPAITHTVISQFYLDC